MVQSEQKKPAHFNILLKIFNGCFAGICGVSCVYPMDLIKTRLQNQPIGPNGERMYTSIVDCFRKTIARDGFRGLYRGAPVNILLIGPEKAIKLTANDFFCYQLATNEGVLSLPQEGLAGGMAGLCMSTVTTPMELLKIQVQVAAAERAKGGEVKQVTAMGLTKKFLRERGFFGLYKGYRICALRDSTFSGTYFPLMNFVNDRGPRKTDGSGAAVAYWSLLAGLGAGMTAALIATPLDVIKTRLQAADRQVYNGIADSIRKTLKHEGVLAFFNGGVCRIMVMAPLLGIAQMFYFFGIAESILGLEKSKSL